MINKFIVIFCTISSKDKGKKIAEGLVKKNWPPVSISLKE